MADSPLRNKKDRRTDPNRRQRGRGGRRLDDVASKAVRLPCPDCGTETVEELEPFGDRYRHYACQVCGRRW